MLWGWFKILIIFKKFLTRIPEEVGDLFADKISGEIK